MLVNPQLIELKKSSHLAEDVKIYCFNSKADVWWSQSEQKIKQLKASVYQFNWENIQELAALVERTMDVSISITGDSAYIAAALGECEVNWQTLQELSFN